MNKILFIIIFCPLISIARTSSDKFAATCSLLEGKPNGEYRELNDINVDLGAYVNLEFTLLPEFSGTVWELPSGGGICIKDANSGNSSCARNVLKPNGLDHLHLGIETKDRSYITVDCWK